MASTRDIPWFRIAAESAAVVVGTLMIEVKNFSVSLLLALLLLGPGQAFGSDDDRTQLIAIEMAISAAVVNLDFDTMDRTYAEDFVFYHSTGVIEGKDEWIRKLRNGEAVYTARIIDSIEVDFHGDTAITSGRIHLKTKSEDPKRQEFTVWYYRIYEKRDNRWQMVSHRSLHEEFGPLKD